MPNGEDKKNNFVLKIWDNVKQEFRPSYIAPDATDTVQGDVKLSDATDSTLDAANGMTAATPKAVKAVQDNVNNKLDKVLGADQTVVSKVTFNESLVLQKGATIPTGQYLTGNVNGNTTTATTLQTARTIAVKNGNATQGSASFSGAADITINMPQIDATTLTGLVPMASIPQGAMERLIKVADEEARFALTTDNVQLGDSVLQLDTGVMYIVIDQAKLNSADGYQEYSAGTAVSAERVEHALTVQKNGTQQFVYDGSTARTLNIALGFSDLSGTIAASQIPNSIITSAHIADGTIVADDIANSTITTAKLADSSVNSAKIVNGSVTGTDIAANTVSLTNLAADVGTTAVQSSQPTDNNVVLWIQI